MTLEESIQDCIDKLTDYVDELVQKREEFLRRICKVAEDEVKSVMRGVDPKDAGDWNVTYSITGAKATIYLRGENVAFIEFSAGITYGTSHYPLESGSDMGMGTYPTRHRSHTNTGSRDKGKNWNNPYGWYYKDDSGQKVHTFGNKAYMPMYHADMAIRHNYLRIAEEVFGAKK